MAFERLHYTARGAVSYLKDYSQRTCQLSTRIPHFEEKGDLPTIVFTFWYPPSPIQAKYLMNELHRKFKDCKLPIGVGLFTRPMGDVKKSIYDDHDYDSTGLTNFLEAAVETSTPVFINTSGMQWTEVAYQQSPLLQMLESRPENLMMLSNGKRVQRKLQPPGNLLRGRLGSDPNGVLYLSPHANEVKDYRYRNLFQMAAAIYPFADKHPELFLGISTENETDYPGSWITGNETVEETHQIAVVKNLLRANIRTFQKAGLTKIYTNQSVEDASHRASPLETADIPESQIGITAWRTGNEALYKQTAEMAQKANKDWALVITNPLSLNQETNIQAIQSALKFNPRFIGLYNWWPHFWGYGIRGLALEKAINRLG